MGNVSKGIIMKNVIAVFIVVCLVVLTTSSCKQKEAEEEKGPLFPIVKNGKYGFINKSGEVVIKPQFHSARDFSEGLAMICVKRKGHYLWGYIHKTGRIVIDPQFANVEVRTSTRPAKW
jgi:hypothetical protein